MKFIKKLREILRNAHDTINEEEAEKERKTQEAKVFRVGSSGAVVGEDIYATQCGRLAQARFLGYQSPPTEEMRVMFNGGTTLEDYIDKRFTTTNQKFQRETTYTNEIAPGIVVSGRPDFEIDLDGEIIGIEIKSLASPFSVIKFKKNKFPFMKHLIQAASYMTVLNRDKWLIAVGHSFHVNDRGFKVPPEVVWFELSYINDMFVVTNGAGQNMKLPFNKEHIINYYMALDKFTKERKLVGRPKEEELNVDTYSRCKYCPMQSACNRYDAGFLSFDNWLEMVSTSKEPDNN